MSPFFTLREEIHAQIRVHRKSLELLDNSIKTMSAEGLRRLPMTVRNIEQQIKELEAKL